VPEEKMAGDTSVTSSTPRHAQVHVAQAPAQNRPVQNKPAPAKAAVTPGNSGLDAANESKEWQRAADEWATVCLQADDELPGKLDRIEGSGLTPNQKAVERTKAIVSAAQLHQEALKAADDNVQNQEELHPVQWTKRPDGTEHAYYNPAEHTALNSARILKQVLDTALAHAEYTEFHVTELHDQLVKTSGAAPDATLTKEHNEAVSNNVASWRVARNNALMARDHANEIQSPHLPELEVDLTFCQEGLSRAEQLAKIAPGPHKTLLEIAKETIEIAKAGRQQLTAKAKLVTEAKAQLAKVKPEKTTVVGNYVKKLERERKELVISNFAAWREALSHANGLVPQNGQVLDIARKGFDEANALLHDVAPELKPIRR
jgi:hypothetical protein